MTSFRQVEANRRNALRSTGPKTDEGKRRSRLNAVRHGLTAETVIASLEDAKDYRAFEAAIIADYCAETAVARELVLRLASLLWRLRRATAIETDLLEIQAEALREREAGDTISSSTADPKSVLVRHLHPHHRPRQSRVGSWPNHNDMEEEDEHPCVPLNESVSNFSRRTRNLTYCFLRLADLDSGLFERLNRYEAALWRQAVQIIFTLHPIKQR
jgi:hypothetical protein